MVFKPGKIAVVFMAQFLSSGFHVGGEITAVFGARVFRMRSKRGARAARVLPEASALIPMKAQTRKRVRCGAVADLGKLQPKATLLGSVIPEAKK
jgi:hypothetical protein